MTTCDIIDSGGASAPARGAQRRAGGSGAAAPRLDKRTYLDKEQGRYKVILRDYGSGLAEISWGFIPNRPAFNTAGRGESEHQEQNGDRAVRRARSRLRQLVLSANLNHLLTLTYRENVTDFLQASDDLRRFVRALRTHLPAFVYVAVPEKQKRGAWHWHLAVAGRQDVDLLRRVWRQVVVDGNIDVQEPKRGQNRRLALVRYLGKYLAKGFAEGHKELNRHRFRASLGIQVPSRVIDLPPKMTQEVSAYVIAQLRQCAGSVGFAWVDAEIGAGWACSWR